MFKAAKKGARILARDKCIGRRVQPIPRACQEEAQTGAAREDGERCTLIVGQAECFLISGKDRIPDGGICSLAPLALDSTLK